MNLIKKALGVIACACATFDANATNECMVHVRLVHQLNHQPCKRMIVLVKTIGVTTTGITDANGRCYLEFNTSEDSLRFYAVRKRGDTILLQAFYNFPKSFKIVNDQEFKTTFYLK